MFIFLFLSFFCPSGFEIYSADCIRRNTSLTLTSPSWRDQRQSQRRLKSLLSLQRLTKRRGRAASQRAREERHSVPLHPYTMTRRLPL
ncbi:hypothetical protein BDV09DRAFT_158430 [Aspergillus tetrazonus]